MRRIYHIGLVVTWLVVAAALLLQGLEYYVTPLAERPFAGGHEIFAPTGRIGNRLGIAGAAMMAAGVLLYSTRKRWPLLSRAGRLRDWLSLHIFLCTLGPFLVVLHTSFRVRGLVAIAFWSMIVVVASGVLGRYVYVRIPHAVNGRARTLQEIESEQRALLSALREQAGAYAARLERWLVPVAPSRGVLAALGTAAVMDLRAGREHRQLARTVGVLPAPPSVREQILSSVERHRRLSRERALLEPLQRLFGYWHAFHLPLAIVMLLVLAVHIAVAIAFGYGWTP
ncbi:MAG TPA: hypothetical protein VFZ24_05950 [Longimicrobiales bacterium]